MQFFLNVNKPPFVVIKLTNVTSNHTEDSPGCWTDWTESLTPPPSPSPPYKLSGFSDACYDATGGGNRYIYYTNGNAQGRYAETAGGWGGEQHDGTAALGGAGEECPNQMAQLMVNTPVDRPGEWNDPMVDTPIPVDK